LDHSENCTELKTYPQLSNLCHVTDNFPFIYFSHPLDISAKVAGDANAFKKRDQLKRIDANKRGYFSYYLIYLDLLNKIVQPPIILTYSFSTIYIFLERKVKVIYYEL